jgi:hypothetical protein
VALDGLIEGSAPFAVPRVPVSASQEQHLSDIGRAGPRGHVKGRRAPVVCMLDIRAVKDKQVDQGRFTWVQRLVKGSAIVAHVVDCVDLGAASQEKARRLEASAASRLV